MADGTKIEWADATVNAINGCSLASPGCTNCYAMKQAHRFAIRQGLTQPSKGGMVWTGEVRFAEEQLLKPLRWRKPRSIFWNAHGDTFHEAMPDEWIDKVFAVCALTPQHRHMILTKRSARMQAYIEQFSDRPEAFGAALARVARSARLERQVGLDCLDAFCWPLPNVWLGVSAEDQRRADERIPDLLATPAAVRFVSAEPLLGPVEMIGLREHKDQFGNWRNGAGIDWVIVGGESGPGARPMHPDWARSLRDQCEAAGVAFHFKQWGDWAWAERVEGDPSTLTAYRAGKRAAGRLLDAREHNGVPA